MKHFLPAILCILIALSVLSGCGNVVSVPADTVISETGLSETILSEAGPADVFSRLETVEMEAARLHNELVSAPSLTQADMNDRSYQIYLLWDGLLNEIWQQLPTVLTEVQMQQLTQEEWEWISRKEEAIDRAAAIYGGGSLSGSTANQRGAALTRERAYYLAGMLAGQEIAMPAEYNGLYPSASLTPLLQALFLPLAEGWHVLDYAVFRQSAEDMGFSITEYEGMFDIYDPDAPGSYLFGQLTLENDALQISQLGYCRIVDSGERSIRVDFAEDSQRYYISAIFWDEGIQVDTLQEMLDYLTQ